ncbi:RelA/SpoT domain-containing protein [Yersinia ruckeri]|uniref:RelA/SpoT domain-containing protein n=1 Tax=Yersinia ruckeri TaxID=29486 RepID=UPI000BDF276F|nr:RelA/SpoT domain-containing protein [Yersinia ruckeri]MCK8539034.1 RelA/SpoT domain-containing protein [Yersinia ruckeri]MCK8571331.1 RelA/SpoT domain-containing protein [Yersinia ruckeri]MCK8574707.1 RelA/SpoT domain-containing protein [Yersinia ruckeri]MCK8578109.1 RelA/SpoT domain-containing protein [Yersinia ruckeri]MCK8581459.1 RelA/SpoT domain-containing protein [Yersinia ruckeri]
MGNQVYENQKCTLEYSKSQIDKSAQLIRHGCEGEERNKAIAMVQNYRELHLYPLMLMKNHLARASVKVGKKIIVVRRLKRLSTIIDKLERPTLDGKTSNAIRLTRMQDIGGCRAIVKNLEQLKLLQDLLSKSRSIHKIVKISSYLTPKPSGYGGVHLIYSCFDNSDDLNSWKKTKIEVQLRTELQHAWATSLEIIDTLEDIKLKTSNEGHEDWRRFFYITGCLVAHDEKACILDERQVIGYRHELAKLESSLSVIRTLARYTLAIRFTTHDDMQKKLPKNHKGYFLLTIPKPKPKPAEGNNNNYLVSVMPFRISQAHLALDALKKNDADENVLISVLLSAENVRTLKKAYPNYFGSTTQFTNFLTKHIDKLAE